MSEMGQSRHFGRRPTTSGLPLIVLQKSFYRGGQKFRELRRKFRKERLLELAGQECRSRSKRPLSS
jgi:hypothetical protein